MIDWKRKLASRKLWALAASVAASVFVLIGAGEETIIKVTALITTVGAATAYIFAEASVDAAHPGDDHHDRP